ncbi:MAG: glycogen debranching enzyme, partial [Dietzia sp.]|nr:glycogen debranching enzyme [Dietzia sp.]
PPLWTEWNGKYRDTVRDFWRGVPATLGEFASRITGSSDLYEHSGRRPIASINFITAHDGFTLRDVVSYNDKHNEANGEDGNDGESHNRSWNCGVEGPTDDPEVLRLRHRQRRNMLTTLILSQGTPMIAHGDEIARTQGGNNNVYCQDNEIAWMSWDLDEEKEDLLEFTRTLVRLRKDHPVFRRRRFFGTVLRDDEDPQDIAWFSPDGSEMTHKDWDSGFGKSLAVYLNGEGIHEPDERGQRIVDDSFLLLFNAHHEPIEFSLLGSEYAESWEVVLDTAVHLEERTGELGSDDTITVADRGTIVLRKVT